MTKLKFIGQDDWSQDLYQGPDRKKYVYVDGAIYTMTKEGEPLAKVKFEYELEKKVDESVDSDLIQAQIISIVCGTFERDGSIKSWKMKEKSEPGPPQFESIDETDFDSAIKRATKRFGVKGDRYIEHLLEQISKGEETVDGAAKRIIEADVITPPMIAIDPPEVFGIDRKTLGARFTNGTSTGELNESSAPHFSARLEAFLDAPWQEDQEIYFVDDLRRALQEAGINDLGAAHPDKAKAVVRNMNRGIPGIKLMLMGDRFINSLTSICESSLNESTEATQKVSDDIITAAIEIDLKPNLFVHTIHADGVHVEFGANVKMATIEKLADELRKMGRDVKATRGQASIVVNESTLNESLITEAASGATCMVYCEQWKMETDQMTVKSPTGKEARFNPNFVHRGPNSDLVGAVKGRYWNAYHAFKASGGSTTFSKDCILPLWLTIAEMEACKAEAARQGKPVRESLVNLPSFELFENMNWNKGDAVEFRIGARPLEGIVKSVDKDGKYCNILTTAGRIEYAESRTLRNSQNPSAIISKMKKLEFAGGKSYYDSVFEARALMHNASDETLAKDTEESDQEFIKDKQKRDKKANELFGKKYSELSLPQRNKVKKEL